MNAECHERARCPVLGASHRSESTSCALQWTPHSKPTARA